MAPFILNSRLRIFMCESEEESYEEILNLFLDAILYPFRYDEIVKKTIEKGEREFVKNLFYLGMESILEEFISTVEELNKKTEQILKMGVITPLMMVSSVFLILTTSPSLAWIVAISLPFLAVVVWYVAVKTRPLSEKQQATLDKINQYARENLTGLRVIRAFAREDFQEKKFASENAVYADNSNKLFKLTGLTEPLFVQIIIAMIVAIVWFALEPLGSGTLAIGDLVAFIEYSLHALLSFLFLANLLGDSLVFVGGILSLHFLAGMPFDKALAVGVLPFILPDLGKIIAISFISRPLLERLKGLPYFSR